MICKFCGAEVADGSRFCQSCGNPVQEPQNTQNNQNTACNAQNGYYNQPESDAGYGNANGYNNQSGYSYAEPYANTNYSMGERVLASDADTARTLGIIGIVCAFFFRIAGLVLGIISLSKADKCLRVREDANFRGARKLGVAAVVLNVVLMVLSVLIPIIIFAINAQFVLDVLEEIGLDDLVDSFYYYY